jgi:hypothetical protein
MRNLGKHWAEETLIDARPPTIGWVDLAQEYSRDLFFMKKHGKQQKKFFGQVTF